MPPLEDFLKKNCVKKGSDRILTNLMRGKEYLYVLQFTTVKKKNIAERVRIETFFEKRAAWELLLEENSFLDFLEVVVGGYSNPYPDFRRDREMLKEIAVRLKIKRNRISKYINALEGLLRTSRKK
jgi:hypothetical protein